MEKARYKFLIIIIIIIITMLDDDELRDLTSQPLRGCFREARIEVLLID